MLVSDVFLWKIKIFTHFPENKANNHSHDRQPKTKFGGEVGGVAGRVRELIERALDKGIVRGVHEQGGPDTAGS